MDDLVNLRHAWEKQAIGDRVSDEELEAMTRQMEAAMPYLTERPGYDLAVKDTAVTLANLRSLRRTRRGGAPETEPPKFRIAKDLGRQVGVDFLNFHKDSSHNAMRFVHPMHAEHTEEIFEAGLSECRMLAAMLGGGCYVVHARTGTKVEP